MVDDKIVLKKSYEVITVTEESADDLKNKIEDLFDIADEEEIVYVLRRTDTDAILGLFFVEEIGQDIAKRLNEHKSFLE